MSKLITENRQFPRINATFPIHITPEFLGKTVDLSETGLRLILEKPLLLSRAKAKIQLSPEESIDTEFKVIWNKHLVNDGKFTYGACFIRLKEKDMAVLKDVFMQNQLNAFLDDIKDELVKKHIKHFFIIELKTYLNELLELDLNRGKTQESVLNDLTKLNNNIILKGEKIIGDIENKAIVKKIKRTFRLLVGPWAYKSLIMKRGFEKPRGYPGDYKMLEIIYDKKPLSSEFGRYYDLYFLNNPYAEAVRQRKDKTAEILANAINAHLTPSLHILNLACGPCREIRDILCSQRIHYKGDIFFGLVDHDEEAISFSKQALDVFKQEHLTFSYFQENILKFIDNKQKYEKLFGKQDLIYSIGLIDYFPDKILKKMIKFCLDLLVAKGKLILTIKDKDRDTFAPLPPGWFCDWEFVPRNEQDIIDLINDIGCGINIKTDIDKSGKIIFLEIVKDSNYV